MKLQARTFSQTKIFRTLDWINSTLASCELQKCKVCIHLVNIMKTPWALASADWIHFVKTSSTKAWFIYHSLIPERWPIKITYQKLGKIYMYYITKEEKTHCHFLVASKTPLTGNAWSRSFSHLIKPLITHEHQIWRSQWMYKLRITWHFLFQRSIVCKNFMPNILKDFSSKHSYGQFTFIMTCLKILRLK